MKNKIILRKFPYPFKCALAISSDIDLTPSIKRFVELQKYLCTNEETTDGRGVSLEIGNSFWFFRNSNDPGISYFENTSNKKTEFAEVCKTLVHSGHVDVLHTYGDFNSGGFKKKYAEIAIEEMLKEKLNLRTWVNHGNKLNSQNIGTLSYFGGSNPNSDSYHFDLLKKTDLRYFWVSQITHLVGQDSKLTLNNLVKNQLQKLLALKYAGKQIKPFFSNNLIREIKVGSNDSANVFMRYINPWGKYSYTNAENLPYQLNKKILNELIRNEGYLVLYTHLGNYQDEKRILPEATKKIFNLLSEENSNGIVFITTTTRLLTYYEVWSKAGFSVSFDNGIYRIDFSFSKTEKHLEENLNGITFYTDDPEKTEIYLNNIKLKKINNPKDFSGRFSVSVPWQKLTFPIL